MDFCIGIRNQCYGYDKKLKCGLIVTNLLHSVVFTFYFLNSQILVTHLSKNQEQEKHLALHSHIEDNVPSPLPQILHILHTLWTDHSLF